MNDSIKARLEALHMVHYYDEILYPEAPWTGDGYAGDGYAGNGIEAPTTRAIRVP